MKKEEKEKLEEEFWNIRDIIQELENIKDRIIQFFKLNKELDKISKSLWISDSKEMYYNIIAAWEMLRGLLEGKSENKSSCKGFLERAKSHLGQCLSEIQFFKDADASVLSRETNKVFERCYNALSTKLKEFSYEEKTKKPEKRVIQISDNEYHLICSICGKVAAIFKVKEYTKNKGLLYTGIIHETVMKIKYAEKVFELLKQDKIKEVHLDFEKNGPVNMEEGIDAYCPKCDAIYCEEHYSTREYWDEGFYDYTEGICPKGHKRIIHD